MNNNFSKVVNYFDIDPQSHVNSLYGGFSGLWVWRRLLDISKASLHFALGFVFVIMLGSFLLNEELFIAKYILDVWLTVNGVSLMATL